MVYVFDLFNVSANKLSSGGGTQKIMPFTISLKILTKWEKIGIFFIILFQEC